MVCFSLDRLSVVFLWALKVIKGEWTKKHTHAEECKSEYSKFRALVLFHLLLLLLKLGFISSKLMAEVQCSDLTFNNYFSMYWFREWKSHKTRLEVTSRNLHIYDFFQIVFPPNRVCDDGMYGCSIWYFHECWAHWRVQVLLLWKQTSKAALLPDISPHEFISQPGIIVKSTSMHIIWDGVVVCSASVPLPSSSWLWFMRLVGSSDTQVRQPDAYGISTRVICLPSVCGSWLVSASWIFHEAFPRCTYPTPIITHTPSTTHHSKAYTPTHTPPQSVTTLESSLRDPECF